MHPRNNFERPANALYATASETGWASKNQGGLSEGEGVHLP